MKVCYYCKKSLGFLRREYHCSGCHLSICSKCARKAEKVIDNDLDKVCVSIMKKIYHYEEYDDHFILCPKCRERFKTRYYDILLAEDFDVDTFSVNYRGRVPYSSNSEEYITDYYKNRDDAFREIKKVAMIKGSNIVTNIRLLKECHEYNNYIYNTWAVTGHILLK